MREKFAGKTAFLLRKIKEKRPLVHCITNMVTVNDCANALLAIGAAPVMAHDINECREITQGSSCFVANFGATEYMEAMFESAREAKKQGIPIVIDPVGCGGSTYRRKLILEMIDEMVPCCVRGNLSEIRALMTDSKTAKGVDVSEADLALARNLRCPSQSLAGGSLAGEASENLAGEGAEGPAAEGPKSSAGEASESPAGEAQSASDKLIAIAKELQEFALKKNTIVIASGPVDIVTDGVYIYGVCAGDAMMPKVTGSGCMSSAVLGAFMAQEQSIESAICSCNFMGACGSFAAEETIRMIGKPGLGTFKMFMMNELSTIDENMIFDKTDIIRIGEIG